MRTLVLRKHFNLACRAAAITLLAGAGAGCSSGFSRFDQSLYSSEAVPAASNQYGAAQPYPADVDATSTASINRFNRGPVPASDVSAGVSDHVGYNPDAAYQQAQPAQPAYQQPYPQAPAAPSIQRNALASPIQNSPAYAKPPLLAPQSAARKPLSVDPLPTASVRAQAQKFQQNQTAGARNSVVQTRAAATSQATRVAEALPAKPVLPAKPALPAPTATNERGWTATGGTTIAMREGETVYNLSKRYGVPVSAILAANNIKDASSVKAGQQIVVPTYVYSRNAPVSAPDNDPGTMKASSARGEMAVQQPYQVAAVEPSAEKDGGREDPRYKAKRRVQDAPDQQVPDYSITTGSLAKPGSVTVAPGDSLTKIAAKHSVSVAGLKAANALSSDKLKIGQVLKLPNGPQMARADSVSGADSASGVDPIVTGSNKAPLPGEGPKPYVKPQGAGGDKTAAADLPAPARTGIDEFRWPVRGRVISSFGEKTSSGRNDGIDISVPEGTAVKAAENGVVVYAGDELEGLGNLVLVRHADGWVSAYGHNKAIDVKRGDEVRRGQTIARSGKTGSAEMPKLHFELRKSSAPVDPLKHLGGA